MRQVHRWLAVIFGIFILFIATTGVLSQVGSLVNNGGFEKETKEQGRRQMIALGHAIVTPASAHENEVAAAPPSVSVAAPAFVCPADMICRPKRTPRPGDWNLAYLHHIHSGEEFGPAGVVISLLSGFALLFFAFSGLWMYVQMFRSRSGRETRGGRYFW